MKVRSMVVSAMLFTASALFISVAPANADECSAENPCHTYAMVDNAGNVTNIIVCQPSVCGGGTFAGSRVVPQVAANPETHKNQGGYLANPGNSPVTEANGKFTVTTDQPIVSTSIIKDDVKTTVVQSTISSGTQESFTFNDTVGVPNGTPTMKKEPMKSSTKATLSVTEFDNSNTSNPTSKEIAIFNERQTEELVQLTLQVNYLDKLLLNWKMFKLSLMGWFL